jgi:hypothetical protein
VNALPANWLLVVGGVEGSKREREKSPPVTGLPDFQANVLTGGKALTLCETGQSGAARLTALGQETLGGTSIRCGEFYQHHLSVRDN